MVKRLILGRKWPFERSLIENSTQSVTLSFCKLLIALSIGVISSNLFAKFDATSWMIFLNFCEKYELV
jgi:hypothetical protein